MDDLIVTCSCPKLLLEAVTILLSVCRKYGFRCQPKKCRIGVPTEHPCKVLGLRWNPSDTLSDCEGPNFPPCVLALSEDKVLLTRRDVMSLIAQCYDPLGFQSNLLLRMRLILRRELEKDPVSDLDEFIGVEAFKTLQATMMDFDNSLPIPRVLKLAADSTFYLFCDASGFGIGTIICDSDFNLVRCSAHLIQAVKLPWSIVRKELTSCLEVACLYSETTRAMESVNLSVPTPELYTDNEANYHRTGGFDQPVAPVGQSLQAFLSVEGLRCLSIWLEIICACCMGVADSVQDLPALGSAWWEGIPSTW
ncbi:hypothetical protein Pmar_PMAR001097 [Perkinsus marinus ATCC 50983]|uniref:Reverse transcriptase/retrotransposon-derived protein RNase H-like domain-containing protein n=1 Tax=Perkinsus marinus (strain ATCC 50983 / TXsc) TaxID=423536 RepID=C5KSV0_PERM5|nr:hypothetical protein Pmar_PMAR001097 [Perkinsus marinus ATCC 50983]EER12300.1 hypothetical protein Pmar_PMAR001097 [Perkinsus marinus ATCC 50983]|eukprot:XP_002780505.1 hypothetical protein Pmar_PMAR001097 [Perkinsus marinus ATCC 50983]